MDHIRNRLGLGQVEAAIEESAFGEFTRQRQSRAIFEQRVQHKFCREQTAVARNLNRVFAGVSARGAVNREHHFVHELAVVDDFAVVDGVRRRSRGLQ